MHTGHALGSAEVHTCGYVCVAGPAVPRLFSKCVDAQITLSLSFMQISTSESVFGEPNLRLEAQVPPHLGLTALPLQLTRLQTHDALSSSFLPFLRLSWGLCTSVFHEEPLLITPASTQCYRHLPPFYRLRSPASSHRTNCSISQHLK